MTTDKQNFEPPSFEQRAKANLDASVHLIDKKTQDDLAAIRRKSLSKLPRQTPWLSISTWVPAGALAFCAVLSVFLLYTPYKINDTTQHNIAQPSDKTVLAEQIAMFDLLANPEELESSSDPDFYVWMDEVLADESVANEG